MNENNVFLIGQLVREEWKEFKIETTSLEPRHLNGDFFIYFTEVCLSACKTFRKFRL